MVGEGERQKREHAKRSSTGRYHASEYDHVVSRVMGSAFRMVLFTRTTSLPVSLLLLKSTTTRSNPVGCGFVCTSHVSHAPGATVPDFAPLPLPLSTKATASNAVPAAPPLTHNSASTWLPFGMFPLNAMSLSHQDYIRRPPGSYRSAANIVTSGRQRIGHFVG